jgi:hypothetical protein
MFRAAFSALGINLTLWGAGLFYVEAVKLKPDMPQNPLVSLLTDTAGNDRTIHLAPWLPYTLIGVGVITILYSIALPRAGKH